MNQDDAEEVLDELLALEDGLTEWEMDFIESLDRQRGRTTFSEKQLAVLERLQGKLLR